MDGRREATRSAATARAHTTATAASEAELGTLFVSEVPAHPRAAPTMAPAAVEPPTYQPAVTNQWFPRPRSPSGWMLESIDSPQGDQVERTAATSATAIPNQVVAVTTDRRWWSRADAAAGHPAGSRPLAGPGRCGLRAQRRRAPCCCAGDDRRPVHWRAR